MGHLNGKKDKQRKKDKELKNKIKRVRRKKIKNFLKHFVFIIAMHVCLLVGVCTRVPALKQIKGLFPGAVLREVVSHPVCNGR